MRLPARVSTFLVLFATAVCFAAPLGAAAPFARTTFTPIELGPTRPGGLGLAGHPGGGWLMVRAGDAGQLEAVRVAPDGTVGDAVATPLVHDLELLPEAVAVAPSGRWLAAWACCDHLSAKVDAALFGPDGSLVRMLDLSVPDEEAFSEGLIPTADVAALPGGGFVVVWGASTSHTARRANDLFVARFSADGERTAGPVRLNDLREGRHVGEVAVAATTLVVAWARFPWAAHPDIAPGAFARVLRHDLSPVGEEIGAGLPRSTEDETLAVAPDGRFVLARRVDGPDPAGGPAILLRPFQADGAPAGGEIVAATGEDGQSRLAVEASRDGVVWLSWVDAPFGSGNVRARPFAFDGTPLDAARPTGLSWVSSSMDNLLAVDPAGRMLAVVYNGPQQSLPSFGALFTGQAPPPERALTSPELPGFRAWVLIGGVPGETRWGVAEAECLSETLCASGAVSGRVEALVRVVGPKPNGFLWPTLVKLSTSRIEVWIEQEATGEIRHYVLPGASPGDDSLPGLFDRFGFSPE